ncbi:hypothetical protein LTR66_003972 [Elasticomyces elasticus]|nr:hypothetical protein LTR66_003972 [Elasticomyces elasticus]
MGPDKELPLPADFEDADAYVDSLLEFVASSEMLRTLCGGVHILDFFTREPDLYSVVLPQEWRDFFGKHKTMDILDLLMREDIESFSLFDGEIQSQSWRSGPSPPHSLVDYIQNIRKHCLRRDYTCDRKKIGKLARHVATGMNEKKLHEVQNFADYVEKLTADIASSEGRPVSHLVDFGSGQNYLGRALASPPYNKHIVAVEGRPHNIEGAKGHDVKAKLAPKTELMRNKKKFRAAQIANTSAYAKAESRKTLSSQEQRDVQKELDQEGSVLNVLTLDSESATTPVSETRTMPDASTVTEKQTLLETSTAGTGSIQYVEHMIRDGDLSSVISQVVDGEKIHKQASYNGVANTRVPLGVTERVPLENLSKSLSPSLLVMSLHSCGNLVHHGLRSLVLNPSVSAVAMIGCCYNLLTERLGPPSYKLPTLRPRLYPEDEKMAHGFDPHGFPMSDRLCNYQDGPNNGLRLNITARMLAVQAPQNWGELDSTSFFKRHFYRALLQRIFMDRGIVEPPTAADAAVGGSPLGWTGGTQPIIIGSLHKHCYESFTSYVRGALARLVQDFERGSLFKEKLGSLTDEDIERYFECYTPRQKELKVVWSLMAFSAGVLEATIVVDRWLWLKEQHGIKEAWVESVFEYRQSPRNLVVVGIKK